MKNKIIITSVGCILLLCILGKIAFLTKEQQTFKDTNMQVVLSLEDEMNDNAIWCGTFNLVWNDLKNEIVKQDIVFTPQKQVIDNLNHETFRKEHLREDSYYKVLGPFTKELKIKIEQELMEKFQEKSAILDDFNWENRDPKDYFLYAMLKKEFTFHKAFDDLGTNHFGENQTATYFGISKKTNKEVREQVEVLQYKNEDNFAIKMRTKEDEEVIIVKGSKEQTFQSIYEQAIKKKEDVVSSFGTKDTLKIPAMKLRLKKEIEEVENQDFLTSAGESYHIQKAVQTIDVDISKNGGKIKSEAGMDVKWNGAQIEEARNLNVDDTFVIFLKEKEKDTPYFAMKVSDITQFQ